MLSHKPNVLLIVTDDQRYDTIHGLGNDDIITPHLDALVHEGTACRNAYIPCGLTGAVCMPSRAMLHTGKGLFSIYGNGETIPICDTLLGECLRGNGYHAFGTGKWHNGPPSFTRSFDEGTNAFFSGMWDHWNVPVCRYDPSGQYDNVVNFVMDFYHSHDTTQIHCDEFKPGVHSSTLLADSTIEFIDRYDGKKPFFCYTAFLAPHDPRTMPKKYLDMYAGRPVALPRNFMTEYPVSYGEMDVRDETLAPYPRTSKRIVSELTDYYAMITHLDDEIGRIVGALKERGFYDDTLIILCGDNGLGMGSHGFMGKQNHFEHSVKVPLVFVGPGIPRDHVVDAKLFLYDVFPTICDLLGVSVPSSVEGRSFKRCLFSDDGHRDELYFAYGASIRSLRCGAFKLSEYLDKEGRRSTLLFDIEHDPDELHDLSDDDSSRPLLLALREKLFAVATDLGDTDRAESKGFWERYRR